MRFVIKTIVRIYIWGTQNILIRAFLINEVIVQMKPTYFEVFGQTKLEHVDRIVKLLWCNLSGCGGFLVIQVI